MTKQYLMPTHKIYIYDLRPMQHFFSHVETAPEQRITFLAHGLTTAPPSDSSISSLALYLLKVSKGAKIRNRYNQVPHLTQDTNGKVTNSQFDTTNESLEVSPFPAGGHKAHINRRTQRHSKHKREKHKRSTKSAPLMNAVFSHINVLCA